MSALKLLFDTLTFFMLSVTTVSVVYIALWFAKYERYII